MERSIAISPEVRDRDLQRETDKVNESFQDAGQVDLAVDDGALGDLESPDLGGGVGGGGGGIGGAAGAGALASRIPKPIAGVATSVAMPVALAGGVGAGMLSAMHGASARMQTSTSLLGQAWNNVWRPLGDRVDELFYRDVALDILDATQRYNENLRDDEILGAIEALNIPEFVELATPGGAGFAKLFDVLAMAEGTGFWSSLIPEPDWSKIFGSVVSSDIVSSINWPELAAGDVIEGIIWPTIASMDVVGPINWPSINAEPIVDAIGFPSLSTGDLTGAITGGDDGGNDTGGRDSDTLVVGGFDTGINLPSIQTGGRIQQSGVAEVHRGELVADPDRLVSELASAINAGSARGGQSASMDTSGVERRLDRLRRDVQSLTRAINNQDIKVGEETVARVASKGQTDSVYDTDPLV